MIKKALQFALLLTKKHQALNEQLNKPIPFLKKIRVKDQLNEINKQMISFLLETAEYRSFIKENKDYHQMYTDLILYYFQSIHHQINFYEMEIDRLEFEEKFAQNLFINTHLPLHDHKIHHLQKKLHSFYQLINFTS